MVTVLGVFGIKNGYKYGDIEKIREHCKGKTQ